MPDYADGPVAAYLEALQSDRPAPGGGSAAALAGALGAAAAAMAANFTVGRPKYAEVEPVVKAALADLDAARRDLLRLVDEDVRAYGQVGPAYQMPRATAAEKAAREAAIQAALGIACDVPIRVCAAALRTLQACDRLVDVCNKGLVSDVAVGAMLAEAAFRAGRVNVEINLKAMSDGVFVAATWERIEADGRAARDLHDRVTGAAAKRMKA